MIGLRYVAILIVGACLFGAETVRSHRRCLPQHEIEPCRCNPRGFFSLVCDNVTDIDQLTESLRKASQGNLQEVSLRFSDFPYVPLQLINFLGFKSLTLRSVTLLNLFDKKLYSRISLEQFHLDSVRMKRLFPWKRLKSLMDLKRFLVSNMDVKKVDHNLLSSLSKTLTSFSLTSTRTTNLSRSAFYEFQELAYISIENNEISVLKRSMFPVPAKIKYFYFGKNKIQVLPDDLFNNMPYLQRVDLRENWIAEIKLTTFNPVWQRLSFLQLDDNPLKCNCKMNWVAHSQPPAILRGTCKFPKDKYGKSIRLLTDDDFVC